MQQCRATPTTLPTFDPVVVGVARIAGIVDPEAWLSDVLRQDQRPGLSAR
jgi:hypothetical protein